MMPETGSTTPRARRSTMPAGTQWRALAPPPYLAMKGSKGQVRRLCSRVQWRNLSVLQRIAAILMLAFWPPAMVGTIPFHLWLYGAGVRRASGKSLLRQAVEQVTVICGDRLAPKHYYRFRLYLPDLRQKAGDFLLRNQMDGFVYPLLQQSKGRRPQPLRDKRRFAAFCQASGLPCVPTLFALKRGGEVLVPLAVHTFDGVDLFVKPVSGSRGARSERWNHVAAVRYRSPCGRELDRAGLLAHLAALSQRESILIQPALSNHPALLDLTSGALCTIRAVSWRNEAGAFEITDAILRMPADPTSSVDNFHAGGIAASIHIASGTLGRATDMGTSPDVVWHDTHPATGALITGRVMPMWDHVVALAMRAHRAFDEHLVVGLDIALLDDGPCLIEGNESPGVGTLQRVGREPLGGRRFGALVAHHLKPYLDA